MDNTATILIVEDNQSILELNSKKLLRHGFNVLPAKNLSQARKFLSSNNIDLIVLDVMLPDGNGFDFCKEVKAKNEILVLFLTGKTQIKDKITGLDGGGDYYLTKPYDFDEFVSVVKSMLRRKISDEIKVGDLTLNLSSRIATFKGIDLHLAPKEFALLNVLSRNLSTPLSADELCQKCWNYSDTSNTSSMLWTHLSRLRKKIEVHEGIYISNIRNKGYVLEIKSLSK